MYFRNYRLRKIWLDQCLKSCVSEDPSTDNMANESKHSSNLNESSFRTIINHSKGSSIGKVCFRDIQNTKTVC